MRVFVASAVLGWLTVAVSLGQQPTFDVASVKSVNLASHPTFGNSGGPGTAFPGRIHFCCVGMFSLFIEYDDTSLRERRQLMCLFRWANRGQTLSVPSLQVARIMID
jgi:hypothetical protein